jgi:hypothetical protein
MHSKSFTGSRAALIGVSDATMSSEYGFRSVIRRNRSRINNIMTEPKCVRQFTAAHRFESNSGLCFDMTGAVECGSDKHRNTLDALADMDPLGLRICECRCGAPGWRTTRLGVGDPM